jgi:S-adenosylhomocysteine hydrolase
MALQWVDKRNGIDEILAEDINHIANAVIEAQEKLENLETPDVDLSNYYTKEEIDNKVGDIETALDNIIAIQENLIGGGSV